MNCVLESQKFFNRECGKNKTSWAASASAYYRQIGGCKSRNFMVAMATYYAKVNAGLIPAPINLGPKDAVVTDGQGVYVYNSAGSFTTQGTLYTTSNKVRRIELKPYSMIVANEQLFEGVEVTGEYTDTVKFNVQNGTLYGIELS